MFKSQRTLSTVNHWLPGNLKIFNTYVNVRLSLFVACEVLIHI